MVQKWLPYLLVSADKNPLNNSEPENARKAATQLWAELKIGVACVKKNTYIQIFSDKNVIYKDILDSDFITILRTFLRLEDIYTNWNSFIQAILMSGRWHRKLSLLIEFLNSIFFFNSIFKFTPTCILQLLKTQSLYRNRY